MNEMNETKEKKARVPSTWMVHVKNYREKHPKLSYKECLINASKTYKKKKTKTTKTKTKTKTK